MQLQKTMARFGTAAAALLAALLAWALPARAETFEQALAHIGTLQSLAGSYAAGTDGDVLNIMLTYTRMPAYDTALWQMIAGSRDLEFDAYVEQNAPELTDLRYAGTVSLPNGQNIDFSHMLASLQLVYKGVPVPGSWGGDSMQLAKQYLGQASDEDSYMALMQSTFNTGGESVFGNEDLRADLDSVNLGAQLTADTDLAALLRDYYTADLTDYDRATRFTALTFGNINTGSQGNFRQTVYNTLLADTGMQLLLYINGMWQRDTWQVNGESEPALRAAASLFADALALAVNGERVTTESDVRMTTAAGQTLSDLLTAIGDPDAAAAALQAFNDRTVLQIDDATGVDGVLDDATQRLRDRFDPTLFRTLLMALGGAALLGVFVCLGLAARDFVRRG